jgi:acyl-CoA reductase-like NAD-dependent aldehyde dehydrogenase
MTRALKCITPVDGSVYVERPLSSLEDAVSALSRAQAAQQAWRRTGISQRQALLGRAVDAFVADGTEIAREISWQMGRPVSQAPGEIRGFEERARYMIEIAPQSLEEIDAGPKKGFTRFVRRCAPSVSPPRLNPPAFPRDCFSICTWATRKRSL